MKTQKEIQEHLNNLKEYNSKLKQDWDNEKWWSLHMGKKIVFGLIEKLLFIGGHYDGKWKHIKNDQFNVKISTIDIYTKRSLHGTHMTFHIMVKEDIPTNEWLEKLINGYKGE